MSRTIVPDRAGFAALAADHDVVRVSTEMSADWWTPVGLFHRLAAEEPHAFLLESVEGGERIGRWSFAGRRPWLVVRVRGDRVTAEGDEAARVETGAGDPLDRLRRLFASLRAPGAGEGPPFLGGAVGYFGYDTVRWVERLPDAGNRPAAEDDAVLLFFREAIAFDHVRRRLVLTVHVPVGRGDDPDALHDRAVEELRSLVDELHAPFAPPAHDPAEDRPGDTPEPASNFARADFEAAVRRAQEHIAAGDVFQVVLSQRFTVPSRASDLDLFRSLRAVNPSPYMFLLRFGDASAVGSSPEPLVRVEEGMLRYRPIAGTAPRSGDAVEDDRRAEALRVDPKEIAEHVMLVDLGRNDLGRVAETGSVTVDELMTVERYSHVMHLVSGLSARLRPGLGPLDALFACFPAGTVSGAPKVRAMEIIEDLEPDRRGLYAGAVGYVDLGGNLDTCIALRTMLVRNGAVTVQAGAGIVADSDPAREYEETRHKARALLEAVRRAEPAA